MRNSVQQDQKPNEFVLVFANFITVFIQNYASLLPKVPLFNSAMPPFPLWETMIRVH